MAETTSMTLRINLEDAEKFKEKARMENCSQGEFLKRLLDEKEKKESEAIGGIQVPANDSCLIKVLLKESNQFTGKTKEAKLYSFQGNVVFAMPMPRALYTFSYQQIEEELGVKLDSEEYMSAYQFVVYYQANEERYLVYEYINISNTANRNLVNIRRGQFAKDLNEIIHKLGSYASLMEIEAVEYQLSEDISSNKEMIEMYIGK